MKPNSEQLKRQLEQEPNNAALYFQLGLTLQEEFPGYSLQEDHGTFKTYEYKGIDELQKATELEPLNYEYMFTYAQYRVKRGDLDPALRVLKRCAEINPKAEGLYEEIMRVNELIAAQKEKQKAHAQQTLDKKPESANALRMMASAFGDEDNYEEAVKYYERSLEVPDADPELTYVMMGGMQERLKRYDEAIASFHKAIEHFKPSEPDEDDLADPDYKPDNCANSYVSIADCYLELKEYDKAEDYYRQALVIDPEYDHILVYLASLEYNRGNFEKSLEIYLDAIDKVDPKSFPTLDESIGLCYFQLNDFKNAKLWLEKCIKKNKGYSQAYYNLAVVYDRLGDEEGTEMVLQMAVQAKQNDINALYQLAKIYKKQGYLKDALEMLEKALYANPFETTVMELRAEIYASMGDSEKAEMEAGMAKFIQDLRDGKPIDFGDEDEEEDEEDYDEEDDD